MMGDWQGLILRQGVRSSMGPGLKGHKLRESLAHCQRKALRAVGEANSGKWGKFVRNSYEMGTKLVQISYKFVPNSPSRIRVNLA